VGTWLAQRERMRVDAATTAQLSLIHRDTLTALRADLAAGAIDAVLVSAAIVRPADVVTLAGIVRDFPGSRVVGIVADADEPRALAGALALGHAGAHAIIDARDAQGYTALRSAFDAQHLPDSFVRHALAELTAPAASSSDGESDGGRENTSCTTSWRRFVAVAFTPRTSSVKLAAAQLGVVAATLTSRFWRAGLPSPKRYITLARLVWAAHLGETPGLSVAAIAMRIDASSPQSFGRTVRTFTGLTAADWRRQVDGAAMLAQYRATLIDPYRATLATFNPLSVSSADRQARRGSGSGPSRRSTTRRSHRLAGRVA
jgi:AraC-like DNA-binding protein